VPLSATKCHRLPPALLYAGGSERADGCAQLPTHEPRADDRQCGAAAMGGTFGPSGTFLNVPSSDPYLQSEDMRAVSTSIYC